MKKEFYEKILLQLSNPSRVQVCFMKGYEVIMSRGNTNDTVDWFYVNSDSLEKFLVDNGMSWCYLLEKAKGLDANIYLFIGEKLCYDDMLSYKEDYFKDNNKCLEFFIELKPFKEISQCKYEHESSAVEEALYNHADNVFIVREP